MEKSTSFLRSGREGSAASMSDRQIERIITPWHRNSGARNFCKNQRQGEETECWVKQIAGGSAGTSQS